MYWLNSFLIIMCAINKNCQSKALSSLKCVAMFWKPTPFPCVTSPSPCFRYKLLCIKIQLPPLFPLSSDITVIMCCLNLLLRVRPSLPLCSDLVYLSLCWQV